MRGGKRSECGETAGKRESRFDLGGRREKKQKIFGAESTAEPWQLAGAKFLAPHSRSGSALAPPCEGPTTPRTTCLTCRGNAVNPAAVRSSKAAQLAPFPRARPSVFLHSAPPPHPPPSPPRTFLVPHTHRGLPSPSRLDDLAHVLCQWRAGKAIQQLHDTSSFTAVEVEVGGGWGGGGGGGGGG